MTLRLGSSSRRLPQQPILIAGIPASGKTTFARWLADQKGFCHLDLEGMTASDKDARDAIGWDAFCADPREEFGRRLVDKLKVHGGPRVVLSWGFPVQCIGIVGALKASGVGLWWFGGDWTAARAKFIQRGYPSEVGLFDFQRNNIVAAWPAIQSLFWPNIVEVLSPQGSFLTAPELYRLIFPK